MDQYICFLRARETFLEDRTPAEAAVIGQHFAHLSGLLAGGMVMLAGRTMDAPPVGIVLLRGEEDAVRAAMESDPAVAAGVFRMELRPFRVALADLPPVRP